MRQGNKSRRIFGLAGLALLAGLVVYLILVNRVFLVRSVRVEGEVSAGADEIARAAGVPFGEKMRDIDAERIRLALGTSGVYELVGLEKDYPFTLVLSVRERSRDAMVLHAGVILTLEKDGSVVETTTEVPDNGAIYVTGLDISGYQPGQTVAASAGRLQAMQTVIEALDAQDARAYVSELNVGNTYALYLYSRTGIRVSLGDAQNMDRKIIWMVGALRDLEARGEAGGSLDVSSGDKADYSA